MIQEVCALLKEHYVYPDISAIICDTLHKSLTFITDPWNAISTELEATYKDSHACDSDTKSWIFLRSTAKII